MRPRLIEADRQDTPPAGAASATALPARESADAPRLRPLPCPPAHATAVSPAQLWAGVHLPGGASTEKLEQLAGRAQRFTPRVSLVPPDGLLLEIRGSLHLFAGTAGLREQLRSECLRLQLQPLLAIAPTPLAALAAARAGQSLEVLDAAQLTGQLSPLPLTALRWPEETRARLALIGVRTIGAVLRLPRAGFARRFGRAQLAMLDVLTGRSPDVRTAFHARECFRRRRELDCELTHHALLHAALAPLFADLGDFLAARQCGVVELECRLTHRHAPLTRCVLPLAAPSADGQRLAALLGERLDALRLPEPVRACELRAEVLVPHLPAGRPLWSPGEHGGDAADEGCDLIERLRARLGPAAVHGLTLREEHRPESAWAVTGPPPPAVASRRTAPGHRADSACAARAAAPRSPRRPLWILPAPQPLAVRDGLPRRRGALRLVSEPERIETGWWDGSEVARDYYTAIDVHGVRLWVFRERAAPHGWFLHGVFG
jgi:protein ImuB